MIGPGVHDLEEDGGSRRSTRPLVGEDRGRVGRPARSSDEDRGSRRSTRPLVGRGPRVASVDPPARRTRTAAARAVATALGGLVPLPPGKVLAGLWTLFCTFVGGRIIGRRG